MNFPKFSIVKINGDIPDQAVSRDTYGIFLGYDLDLKNYHIKILSGLNNQKVRDGKIVDVNPSLVSPISSTSNNEYSILYNEVLEIYWELEEYVEFVFSKIDKDFYKKNNLKIKISVSLSHNAIVCLDDIILPPEDSAPHTQVQLEFKTVNCNGIISILSTNQNIYEGEYSNQRDLIEELFGVLINRFQAYLEYKLEKRERDYSIFSMFPPGYSARDAIHHLLIRQFLNVDHLFRYCDPFEICSQVSTLLSEGEACAGKILFVQNDFIENNYDLIKLKTEIQMVPKETRKIRKILGTTEKEYYLVADGYKVYGLLSKNKINNLGDKTYCVSFKKQFYWQLGKISGKNPIPIADIQYYDVKFPKQRISAKKLENRIESIFDQRCDIKRLSQIIDAMIDQRHGTMVVILEEEICIKESERLENQSFTLGKVESELDSYVDLTNIDGSILLNSYGKCYALGVILDGEASEKCNISRGARYNSAIRYSENIMKNYNSKKVLIVVISEDGMIDIFPTEDD